MEYPKLRPGDKVILGKHRSINGQTYWSSIMDTFVGKEAIINSLYSINTSVPYFSPTYTMAGDIPGAWRICDMTICLNKRNINNPYIWTKRRGCPLPEGMY